MKVFRCPYCGEKAFGWGTLVGTARYGHRFRAVEKAYMTCKHCGSESEYTTAYMAGKDFLLSVTLALAVLTAMLVLPLIFQTIVPAVMGSVLLFLICVWQTYMELRFKRFTRKGEHTDALVPARIHFNEKHRFAQEDIYLIRPDKSDLQKDGIAPRYIVAVTVKDSQTHTYNLRFIDPVAHSKFLRSGRPFTVWEENKPCGHGEFLRLE